MSILSNDFKEGYCDGYGQAIENVRYCIVNYLKEQKEITIDKVNSICDICSEIDEKYLEQK